MTARGVAVRSLGIATVAYALALVILAWASLAERHRQREMEP